VGDLTVGADSVSLLIGGTDDAVAAGVEGDLILLVVVDALEDVDLPSVGPVGTVSPDGRPQTACIVRDVIQIDDQETSGEGPLRFNSNRVSSVELLVSVVDSEIDGAIRVDLGQTSGLGISMVEVLD